MPRKRPVAPQAEGESSGRRAVQGLRQELLDFTNTSALLESVPNLVDSLAAPVARLRRSRGLERNTIPAVRMRKKGKTLAKAVRRVEELVRDPDLALLLADLVVLSPGRVGSSRQRVDEALRGLAVLRDKADQIAKLGPRRGRGQPPDQARIRFSREVALVLRNANVPLKKYRDGVFARVLGCALGAAGEKQPEDIFDLTKPAVDAVAPSPGRPRTHR